MIAAKFSGEEAQVTSQMQCHCAQMTDLRNELLSEFEMSAAALKELSGSSHIVDTRTSASAGCSSVGVEGEQPQHSSTFPRDIERTNRLASPNKKKSRKG